MWHSLINFIPTNRQIIESMVHLRTRNLSNVCFSNELQESVRIFDHLNPWHRHASLSAEHAEYEQMQPFLTKYARHPITSVDHPMFHAQRAIPHYPYLGLCLTHLSQQTEVM